MSKKFRNLVNTEKSRCEKYFRPSKKFFLVKIADAVRKVYSEDEVAILIDIGSALFTAEMVIEELDLKNVEILDCPLVEGAIVVAVASRSGNTLKDIVEKVAESRKYRKIEV